VRATKVNAGLAESNGRLLLGIWRDSLHVTCVLTACTPGSAPGPTLGNEYGKTLPLLFLHFTISYETDSMILRNIKSVARQGICIDLIVGLSVVSLHFTHSVVGAWSVSLRQGSKIQR